MARNENGIVVGVLFGLTDFAYWLYVTDLGVDRAYTGQVMSEKRNAANDPADYFEYIMFSWGNCQAGDRLVMERTLGRFPNEDDLSIHFNPGVRFYFKYEQLLTHPNAICDGVLPMKVKDEVNLIDWVYKIGIPMKLKERLELFIPFELKDRISYIENDCKDIWDWSEKVYRIIEGQNT